MSAIATLLGADVLRLPEFEESGRLYRASPGARNNYGEWVPGAFQRHDVTYVTAPTGGAMRQLLPDGLREKDLRSFWFTENATAISDTTQGDAIIHDSRTYRVEVAHDWGGFREIVARLPTDLVITEAELMDFDPADFAAADFG